MITNKNEPEYMQIILDEVERELAEERETANREVEQYHLHRLSRHSINGYNAELIAHNLCALFDILIDWTWRMEEPALSSLFLLTIPAACYVRIDGDTGQYLSAMYILTWGDDQIPVIADTAKASILACFTDGNVMRHDLPFADEIQQETKRLYDKAIAVRDLKSVTGPTGEQLKVLFVR